MNKPSDETIEQMFKQSEIVCDKLNKEIQALIMTYIGDECTDRASQMIVTNGIVVALTNQLCCAVFASIRAGFLTEEVAMDMGDAVAKGIHDLLDKMNVEAVANDTNDKRT